MIEGDGKADGSNWLVNFFASLLIPLLAIAIFIGVEYWSDVREQSFRNDLASRGVRASGFVEGFEGKGENIAVFRFHIADRSGGRDIQSSYDMTGTPERSRIAPRAAISVVYDPTLPKNAIPEPFANVPPFDIARHLRFYIFGLGGMYTVFLLPLALFGAWRDHRRRGGE